MASTLTMLFGLWRRNRLKARLIRERLLPEVPTMPLPTDIFPTLGVVGSRLDPEAGEVVEAVDSVPSEPADWRPNRLSERLLALELRWEPDVAHKWSLTQFYSVDFSQSRIGVIKCVFNKRTIEVCVSHFDSDLCAELDTPTVSLYLCSFRSNAWGKSGALEGRRVSFKNAFKGPRRRRGSCWEERKE